MFRANVAMLLRRVRDLTAERLPMVQRLE
jgi:hypothetical protein